VWGEIQSQAQSVGVYNLSRLWITYQALSNCGVTQARSDGRNTFRATDPNKPEKSISNYLSKPERRKTMSEEFRVKLSDGKLYTYTELLERSNEQLRTAIKMLNDKLKGETK